MDFRISDARTATIKLRRRIPARAKIESEGLVERGSRENFGIRQKGHFLLSGVLLPIFRQIKNVRDASFKIVRMTTDEGVRLVGLQVPKKAVKEITGLFDCA